MNFKNNIKLKQPKIKTLLHVQCNLKNTLISLTKVDGKLLKQWSTKSLKKTKFKKNNPYNIQTIMLEVNKYCKLKKLNSMLIFLKGTGLGRYNILKNIKRNTIKVYGIFDKTLIPFNGCRQKKLKRR